MKMMFTILLMIWSKKLSTVVKWWKNILTKNPKKTKVKNEDFENSIKGWVCDNSYVDSNVKVRDHCNINGTHRVSAHRDCNINVN